jgi:hypothetical protein
MASAAPFDVADRLHNTIFLLPVAGDAPLAGDAAHHAGASGGAAPTPLSPLHAIEALLPHLAAATALPLEEVPTPRDWDARRSPFRRLVWGRGPLHAAFTLHAPPLTGGASSGGSAWARLGGAPGTPGGGLAAIAAAAATAAFAAASPEPDPAARFTIASALAGVLGIADGSTVRDAAALERRFLASAAELVRRAGLPTAVALPARLLILDPPESLMEE